MSIGKKIKEIRKIRNISQEKLAEYIGSNITQISKYERDIQTPSALVIKKMSELFEVSADYLLFDDVNDIATAKIKNKKLLDYFTKVENLPQEDLDAIIVMMDAMIFKNEITQISKKLIKKLLPQKNNQLWNDKCQSEPKLKI